MIRTRLLFAFAILIVLRAILPVQAGHAPLPDMQAPEATHAAQAETAKRAVPPLAFVRFCREHPSSCKVRAGTLPSRDGRVVMTPELLSTLEETNQRINRSLGIRMDVNGFDLWSVNTLKGDCEDFALAKRAKLLALGWPSSAVSLAVVRTPEGKGHAVLIARTTDGDLVLDNLNTDILAPARTGYAFLSMQDGTRPMGWFAL